MGFNTELISIYVEGKSKALAHIVVLYLSSFISEWPNLLENVKAMSRSDVIVKRLHQKREFYSLD